MKFIIKIKKLSNNETIKQIGPYSGEREVERAERGLNINLNKDYYTLIERCEK